MPSFIKETSIHGLKYLSKDWSNSICRLLWLLSIVTSSAIAVVIIYQNVSNWETSPSVVVGVDKEDIEVCLSGF